MAGDQLVFDLATRPALGRADFFVAPANALALAQVDTWPDWPGRRLAVVGPAGAGKTHLAHVWAARVDALILPAAGIAGLDLAALPPDARLVAEDADRIASIKPKERRAAEEALFHVANHLMVAGGLMVSGRTPPARWRIRLPDLASRLRAAPVARLAAPDDALLAALLVKLFADRQILVASDLIQYLLTRMDRSFEAAEALVAELDRAGLARQRPITRALAAEMLRRAS